LTLAFAKRIGLHRTDVRRLRQNFGDVVAVELMPGPGAARYLVSVKWDRFGGSVGARFLVAPTDRKLERIKP
jgi:hypothetical protein